MNSINFDNNIISLCISPIASELNLSYYKFLEHKIDSYQEGNPSKLYLSILFKILVKEAEGNSINWNEYDLSKNINGSILRCYTLRNGNHLIFEDESNILHLFSHDWVHITSHDVDKFYPWHGSWSIDESEPGTVIFAEYPKENTAEELRVWKSLDGGLSWYKVLSLNGTINDDIQYDSNHIRHFHTCQYYAEPNIWILSTGDHFSHCRQFFSYDNGETWIEKFVDRVIGKKISKISRAIRRTCEIYSDNHLYWVTDDRLGLGESHFVAMSLRVPETLNIIDAVGINEARALIKISKNYFISITESKVDGSQAAIFLLGPSMEPFLIGHLDFHNIKTGFTYSRGSKVADNGIFYTYCSDSSFGKDVLALQWEFKIKS